MLKAYDVELILHPMSVGGVTYGLHKHLLVIRSVEVDEDTARESAVTLAEVVYNWPVDRVVSVREVRETKIVKGGYL